MNLDPERIYMTGEASGGQNLTKLEAGQVRQAPLPEEPQQDGTAR